METTGPPSEVTVHYERNGLELDVTIRAPLDAQELLMRACGAATYAALGSDYDADAYTVRHGDVKDGLTT